MVLGLPVGRYECGFFLQPVLWYVSFLPSLSRAYPGVQAGAGPHQMFDTGLFALLPTSQDILDLLLNKDTSRKDFMEFEEKVVNGFWTLLNLSLLKD